MGSLRTVAKGVVELRRVGEEMPIRQADIFLKICLEDGIMRPELQKSMRLDPAQMTRHIQALTKLGLVTAAPEGTYPGTHRLWLTLKGKQICRALDSF